MNIEQFINDIIPPEDYSHRNGFSNTHIIDKLNVQEKVYLEEILINKLLDKSDILVIETLAYLKSKKSLPLLYDLLDKNQEETARIIIAESIFEINDDNKMIDIAIVAFRQLEKIKDAYFVYRLSSIFYYLKRFKNVVTDDIIREYTNHSDYLLSFNAKLVLNQ